MVGFKNGIDGRRGEFYCWGEEVDMRRMGLIILVLVVMGVAGVAHAESAQMKQSLKTLASHKGDYTFAVIGDNRSGDRVYKKIVAGTMARKPMFIMNTGDIIPHPGNRKQWAHFFELSKPIDVPYFLTPGNHDIDDAQSQQVWREVVDLPGKETYYSFVVGDDLFVVLNTCEPGHDRRIAGEQLKWLRRTLDAKRYEHQFVFLHHPLYLWKGASHYGSSLDRYPKQRDALHALFKKEKVDAVFAGHEHTYKRYPHDGVEYIVTGGAGAPLYSGFNHFMFFEVAGPRVAVKVVDRKGYLRDEFLLRKPDAQVKTVGGR